MQKGTVKGEKISDCLVVITQLGNDDLEKMSSTEMIYKIGDLAKEFDVTLRTLRFYEDRGLIKPERAGTTRLYSEDDRERLRIALFCKRIGLSIDDIRKVLELHDTDSTDSSAETEILKVYTSQLKALERQQQDTKDAIDDLQLKIAQLSKVLS